MFRGGSGISGRITSGTEPSMIGMTDDTVLDTTIHEPSMTAGEIEMLLFALDRSRAQFAWKCGGLHQPAKYTTWDGDTSPNLRRIVVDLHDEYARHVGHADLLREAVDGLVGEDPPQ
jgi:hypothetical protein